MISYEKVRQSLRSTTFGLGVYHAISLALGLILVGFLIWASLSFKDEMAAATAELQEADIAGFSIFALVSSLFAIILNIVIMVLHFKNVKIIDRKEIPSPLAYYLGIGLTVFNIISSLSQLPKGTPITASLMGLAIPFALLAAYAYATYKYNIYRHKDDDKIDGIVEN